jgi:hypothetical protein
VSTLTGSDPLVIHFTTKDQWMALLVVSQRFPFRGGVSEKIDD